MTQTANHPHEAAQKRELADACPLRVQGVSKRYGTLTALHEVSLAVEPGEIFALLGPNGAGKTTLIHCIAGLTRQSEGTIRVFGYDTGQDFRHTRRLIGLVPQEINFDPFFTPFESLMIHMGLMGVRPDPVWADTLLGTFALASHRNAYTRTLSGGMKRRLLVAKALVHRPKLLFLDEPTAGVDVELRKELWQQVRKLRDTGTTVILTTHYLEEAEQLADRIAIIHHGKLLLTQERDHLMRERGQSYLRVELAEPIDALTARLPSQAKQVDTHTVDVPWSNADDLGAGLETLKQAGAIKRISVRQTHLEEIFVDLIAKANRQP